MDGKTQGGFMKKTLSLVAVCAALMMVTAVAQQDNGRGRFLRQSDGRI
jgi:hypothetical protein